MTVFKHEINQGKLSLAIWSAAVSFMLGLCILIYPEMSNQMGDVSDMFAQMGSFSAAFGMDKINFGEFSGFFGVECGNVLGIGGAFFAALLGITVLSKEEKEHTAEFLFAHPVSRNRIITEKLCAVIAQIVLFNLVSIIITVVCVAIIGEEFSVKILVLLFLAYFIMQIEISAITFGISAFIRKNGMGIGIGLAAVFYFMNIISNLTDKVEFLKYITPFGYTDSADIILNEAINMKFLSIGIIAAVAAIIISYCKYLRKDIF